MIVVMKAGTPAEEIERVGQKIRSYNIILESSDDSSLRNINIESKKVNFTAKCLSLLH